MFDKENHEYEFTKIIKKITGHVKWTILWEEICKSPKYGELLKNTDIKECIDGTEDNLRIHKDYRFMIYQGSYGGVTFDNYCKKYATKKVFTNQKEFNKLFIKLFKLMKNIFYGLTQLYKNNICHHDINNRNILIKGNKSFIIDYDISLKMKGIKQNKFLKKRMIEESSIYRIYESYPFEYIYYLLDDRSDILKEIEHINLYQNIINYYELYKPIHHSIFDTDTDKLRKKLLEDKLKNKKTMDLTELMRKLDTYSLGTMIIILFLDSGEELNIPLKNIINSFRSEELKPYMDLIRDMIKFNYQDRITPDEAYERYLNLIR
jgi:serine/threonine protein kinase